MGYGKDDYLLIRDDKVIAVSGNSDFDDGDHPIEIQVGDVTVVVTEIASANYSKAKQAETTKAWRLCETCKVFLVEGFVINGGESYYCNDHEPSWFKAVYGADPDGDTYWTQWDD